MVDRDKNAKRSLDTGHAKRIAIRHDSSAPRKIVKITGMPRYLFSRIEPYAPIPKKPAVQNEICPL